MVCWLLAALPGQEQDQDHPAGEQDKELHPGVGGLASRVEVGGLVDLRGQGGGL